MYQRFLAPDAEAGPPRRRRPLIGVLCCNEYHVRTVQVVASRFVQPLSAISGADVLLVPALSDVTDVVSLAGRLDGLLLTGARSDVAAHRYDGPAAADPFYDEERDDVALRLSATMIEAGRPVFGICRGMQELNVLFGGSLTADVGDAHHHPEQDAPFQRLFEHRHDVALSGGRMLAAATGEPRITVNSVHRQGILRLGAGLDVEATAVEDGLIEAFSARPCGAPVLAVQWHPEWNVERCPSSQTFFRRIGDSMAAA